MDRIDKFLDDLEETFAHIREREGSDSVCGLCEHDGAYIGESGDWYNECPGFNKDDCFKLSAEIRRKWKAQLSQEGTTKDTTSDTISRQQAVDAIMGEYPDAHYPDWYASKIRALPSAQPEPTTEIQEILNYLDTTLHPIVSPNNWNVYAELHDMVSKLSSAQPERKKGRWQEDPSGYGFWICSACGFVSEASGADLLYNFCPHCGADMRGEQDE